MNRNDLQRASRHPNVAAFLRVIRQGESSQDDASAYTVLWGGSHFQGFADHPRKHFPLPDGRTTSAAGAYQIVETTWNRLVQQYGFEDFSPANQDLAAIALIAGRGALADVEAGRLDAAIRKLPQEWTSLALPKRRAEAAEVFAAFGGSTVSTPAAPPTPPQEVSHMGAALLAFLPQLLPLIPALGQLFSSGSEVANRNVAAATVVGDAIVKATNAFNVEDAVKRIQADPDALNAARETVHELLPQLLEGGGGGIAGARTFAADHENSRYGRILEIVTYAALFFLLIANAMAFAIGWFKDDWGRMEAVTQADIGVALMAFSFFLGSSLSSKRKDERQGLQ